MAEYNVLVTGQLASAVQGKELDLTVNEKYLNGELIVYTSEISSDGYFAFRLTINEPELVSLNYADKRALIFLQPNDTLRIEGNGLDFNGGLKFSGKGAADNEYLKTYFKKYPGETNQFKLKQYKSGNYWYSNAPSFDQQMMTQEPSKFRATMDLRKESAQTDFDFFQSNHSGELSAAFIEFLDTEIIFDWAYHLLLYGNVFQKKYNIQPDFFDFADITPIDIETIGNYWYREYLKAYMDHLHQSRGASGYPNIEKYNIASEYLSGRSLYFMQSHLIARGFKSNDPTTMIGKYWEFIEVNQYAEFSAKLSNIYQQAMKFASGSPAPGFELASLDGSVKSLSDFKGKVLYLNFWASWCKPCVKKMENLKSIQPELKRAGVQFVNISLDKSKDTWKNTIANKGFEDAIHLYADGEISGGVAATYGVKILPQYFIIDKDGFFSRKPKSNDLLSIQNFLAELNQQN